MTPLKIELLWQFPEICIYQNCQSWNKIAQRLVALNSQNSWQKVIRLCKDHAQPFDQETGFTSNGLKLISEIDLISVQREGTYCVVDGALLAINMVLDGWRRVCNDMHKLCMFVHLVPSGGYRIRWHPNYHNWPVTRWQEEIPGPKYVKRFKHICNLYRELPFKLEVTMKNRSNMLESPIFMTEPEVLDAVAAIQRVEDIAGNDDLLWISMLGDE